MDQLQQIKTLIGSLPHTEQDGEKLVEFSSPILIRCDYFPVDYHIHAVKVDEDGWLEWRDAAKGWWSLDPSDQEEADAILQQLKDMQVQETPTLIRNL